MIKSSVLQFEYSTMNSNSNQNVSSFDMSHRTAFAVVKVCQIFFGSLLNGMTLFLLIRNFYLLKVPANVVLLNLAISDFLACF